MWTKIQNKKAKPKSKSPAHVSIWSIHTNENNTKKDNTVISQIIRTLSPIRIRSIGIVVIICFHLFLIIDLLILQLGSQKGASNSPIPGPFSLSNQNYSYPSQFCFVRFLSEEAFGFLPLLSPSLSPLQIFSSFIFSYRFHQLLENVWFRSPYLQHSWRLFGGHRPGT